MADYQNFKISTKNYMGYAYESHCERLTALALSQPDKYYEIRKKVVEYIRDSTVESWFKIFYNALTKGQDADGAPITTGLGTVDYPAQEVSRLCIGIAKTVQGIADQVCDIIIPAKFEELASKRRHDKAAAAGL